jgi:hypothetical protein
MKMSDDLLYLDEYLELHNSEYLLADKIKFYEAIIASLLRKYIAEGNKTEINLDHVYKDTYFDVMLKEENPSIVKVSWREV